MDVRRLAPLLAPLLALAVTGCATDDDALRAADDPAGDLYEATTTVLESPEHGPELCLGGVATSLPPQCGGVPVTNWDWAAVEGAESMNGITWGEYVVVGRYDGQAFTLTDPPRVPEPGEQPTSEGIGTPCDEPDGGWTTPDPARADHAALDAAVEAARAQPDHAGVWVHSLDPPREDESDPARTVLNAAFTGNLERHERELRDVWGGPLCVVEHERTLAELTRIQAELFDGGAAELGLEAHSGGVLEHRGVVQLGVAAITREQQAALDDRYGEGVVEVEARLRPVPLPD